MRDPVWIRRHTEESAKTVSMILTYYTLCNRAEIPPFCTPPKVLQQLLDDAVKQFLQNGATAKTTHVKKTLHIKENQRRIRIYEIRRCWSAERRQVHLV